MYKVAELPFPEWTLIWYVSTDIWNIGQFPVLVSGMTLFFYKTPHLKDLHDDLNFTTESRHIRFVNSLNCRSERWQLRPAYVYNLTNKCTIWYFSLGANARCRPKLLTSIDTGSAVHEMEGLPSAWEMTLTRDPEKRLISDLFTKPWRWTFGIGITGKDQMAKNEKWKQDSRKRTNWRRMVLK